MTHEEVMAVMEKIGLPYAYHHFAEGESPDPPFLVFLYPKFRMLLTGDIGVEDERKILAVEEDKKREKVTLLKAAHHGSNGSSSEEFLECFSPAFTVLSYGEGNERTTKMIQT